MISLDPQAQSVMTPAVDQQTNDGPTTDLNLKGRFARYNSPFLQLLLPVLSIRYLWQAINELNPLSLVRKRPDKIPTSKQLNPPAMFEKLSPSQYLSRNFTALFMGTTVLGVMAYYSKNTYDDIRTLYAEAVGYELDKKPEDVNLKDILFNSRNAALAVTRGAFIKRSLMRFAAGGAFWFPWQMFRGWKDVVPRYNANLNAGVGAVGTYLSLDGFLRTQTFFEAEQELVDKTINHGDTNTNEVIRSKNIQSLLFLQRQHLNKDYKWPRLNSAAGRNEAVLADRIADLLNQTYNNTPRTGPANFTIGKFNYLVGFGLLDTFPESLAFVELANRSSGMKEVNAAAVAIKNGQNPHAVFQQFGIDTNAPAGKNAPPAAGSEPAIKFIDKAPPIKDKMLLVARTHQDFAAKATDSTPSYDLSA